MAPEVSILTGTVHLVPAGTTRRPRTVTWAVLWPRQRSFLGLRWQLAAPCAPTPLTLGWGVKVRIGAMGL